MAQRLMRHDPARLTIITDDLARLRWRVSDAQARGASLHRLTPDDTFEADHVKTFVRRWLPELAQAHGW